MKKGILIALACVAGTISVITSASPGWQEMPVGFPESAGAFSGRPGTHTFAGPDIEDTLPDLSGPAAGWGSGLMLTRAADVAASAEEIAQAEELGLSLDQIAELMANPFSYLWFGMIQNDTYWWDGDLLDELDEDRKLMNTTLIQPVMSLQLTDEARLIFRPVIPINSFDTIDGFDIIEDEDEGIRLTSDWERETGLGDIVLWTAYSPQYTPPFVYGFGPTLMLNTATDDWLGTGKWSAGPMGTAVYITDKWIVGGVAQHWWSFAGDSDRDDVNLTDFQPIVRYRLSTKTNIGIAPNIRYNWDGDSGNKLQLPIGGGISTLVKVGRLPLGIGAEFYYYAKTNDDFGPEYQFRFFLTPVLPAPAWSREPLFGN